MSKQKIAIFLTPEKPKMLKSWAAIEGITISKLIEDRVMPPIDLEKKLGDLITASDTTNSKVVAGKDLSK